jgi:hypothetical protein
VHADLIILGAHRKRTLTDYACEFHRGPHHSGRLPLCIDRESVGVRAHRTALLPVDMSEASTRGIAVARSLGLLGGLSVSMLHALTATESMFGKGGCESPQPIKTLARVIP